MHDAVPRLEEGDWELERLFGGEPGGAVAGELGARVGYAGYEPGIDLERAAYVGICGNDGSCSGGGVVS